MAEGLFVKGVEDAIFVGSTQKNRDAQNVLDLRVVNFIDQMAIKREDPGLGDRIGGITPILGVGKTIPDMCGEAGERVDAFLKKTVGILGVRFGLAVVVLARSILASCVRLIGNVGVRELRVE